jgi:hypothetical protein
VLKDLPIIAREGERLVVPHRRDEMRSSSPRSPTRSAAICGAASAGVASGLIIGIASGCSACLLDGHRSHRCRPHHHPWIGPAITAVVAGVAGATVEPGSSCGVLVVIGAQQLTEWFVQPRVMSGQVDLHPLLVIFSILPGGRCRLHCIVLAIPGRGHRKALFSTTSRSTPTQC